VDSVKLFWPFISLVFSSVALQLSASEVTTLWRYTNMLIIIIIIIHCKLYSKIVAGLCAGAVNSR